MARATRADSNALFIAADGNPPEHSTAPFRISLSGNRIILVERQGRFVQAGTDLSLPLFISAPFDA
jgi:hypothetical protein